MNTSTTQDDIARVLQSAVGDTCPVGFISNGQVTGYGKRFAEALLAAGYRKVEDGADG